MVPRAAMPRAFVLIAASAVAVLALASGAVLTLRDDPGPVAAPPTALAAGAEAAAAPVVKLRPRSGRTLSVADAMKDLDLMRPARDKVADDFTLALMDGAQFKLSQHRGKVVFLNFWATWCPPCLEEMPAMEKLYRHQRDNGLVMLAVSVDSDPKVVTSFLAKLGLTLTVGLDPKLQLANAYGVRALPSTFIVDRHGQLAAVALGPRQWDGDAAHSLVEGLATR